VKSKIEELKEKHAAEMADAIREEAVVAMLPDEVPMPCVSNLKENPGPLAESAWLSFRTQLHYPSLGETPRDPVAILAALEAAGWRSHPATLCKWASWRHAPYPGLQTQMPAEKRGDKLTKSEAIVPLWFRPEQYGECAAELFMTAPDGQLFQICVEVPRVAMVHAHRVEYHGGWRFEGPARLHFPERWQTRADVTVSPHSRGFVDTEQGVSGAVYFLPRVPQEEWRVPASEFLASLLTKEKPR
jgi:hypothetical protein